MNWVLLSGLKSAQSDGEGEGEAEEEEAGKDNPGDCVRVCERACVRMHDQLS